jgi:hypothetical protein
MLENRWAVPNPAPGVRIPRPPLRVDHAADLHFCQEGALWLGTARGMAHGYGYRTATTAPFLSGDLRLRPLGWTSTGGKPAGQSCSGSDGDWLSILSGGVEQPSSCGRVWLSAGNARGKNRGTTAIRLLSAPAVYRGCARRATPLLSGTTADCTPPHERVGRLTCAVLTDTPAGSEVVLRSNDRHPALGRMEEGQESPEGWPQWPT